jgi:y4mF family transcriptional regulator
MEPSVDRTEPPAIGDTVAWMEALGETVRRNRRLAGLTQVDLAQLAGVGKTVVYDLEQGKPTMRMATVLRLLAVLNIRLAWSAPTREAGDA